MDRYPDGEELVNTAYKDVIESVLISRGLEMNGHAYEFFLPDEGVAHFLSRPFDRGGRQCLFLPLFMFEFGFHLPLHPWVISLLNGWGVAPGQLSGMAWACIIAYLIDCLRRGEDPREPVFKNLYYLATPRVGAYVNLRVRPGVKNPVGVCAGGVKIWRDQYVGVRFLHRAAGAEEDDAMFPLRWCVPSAQRARHMPPMTDADQAQFERYRVGNLLFVPEVITLANVFMYCLNFRNPQESPSEEVGWPFNSAESSLDPVAGFLLGMQLEPSTFLYAYCGFREREWIPLEALRGGQTSRGWRVESEAPSSSSSSESSSDSEPSSDSPVRITISSDHSDVRLSSPGSTSRGAVSPERPDVRVPPRSPISPSMASLIPPIGPPPGFPAIPQYRRARPSANFEPRSLFSAGSASSSRRRSSRAAAVDVASRIRAGVSAADAGLISDEGSD